MNTANDQPEKIQAGEEPMEFTVDRAQLIKHLAHVEGIVENRNTIPVLSNVLIEAADGGLVLTTTDLDIMARKTISDVDVKSPGRTTIPMALLSSVIKKTPDGAQVHFKLDGTSNRMVVVAGRARFALATLSGDDFPLITFNGAQSTFTITTDAIEDALKRVKSAISTEETRYYLNGVHFAIEDGKMLAVATDGHRLSVAAVDVAEIPGDLPPIIVPRKAVNELLKLTGSIDGEATIELSDRAMVFSLGDVVLQCKLIDGTFPEYRRVIPATHDLVVKVQANELVQAIDRVSTVSSEKTRQVLLDITKTSVKFSVTSSETGTATEEVSVDSSGELRIGFNGRYLMDVLNGYGGELVELQLGSETAPAKFRSAERPDDVHVLMPMRV